MRVAHWALILSLLAAVPVLGQERSTRRSVERLRGHRFKRPVPTERIDRDALDRLLELNRRRQQRQMEARQRSLQALGLMREPSSRGGRSREARGHPHRRGILGLYLARDVGPFAGQRMYLIDENIRFHRESVEKVYAHELCHALDDQHFDLSSLHDSIPRYPTGNHHADRALALRCLREGVAQIVGETVARWKRGGERGLYVPSPKGARAWRRTPYAKASTLFPYVQGGHFVGRLLEEGSWDAVDRAFRDPPQSTEQILHPERYLRRDYPTRIRLPELTRDLSPEWRVVQVGALGEFTLSWTLGRTVASGWDGDQYEVLENRRTGQRVAIFFTVWDTVPDAAEFYSLLFWGEPFSNGLERGEHLYAEHEDRVVYFVSGLKTPELLAPLLDGLRNRVNLGTHGEDVNRRGVVEGERRSNRVARMVDRSRRGHLLLEKTGPDQTSSFGVLQLDAAGHEVAERFFANVRDEAARGGWEQRRGRYVHQGRGRAMVVGRREGEVVLGRGPRVAEIEGIAGRLAR